MLNSVQLSNVDLNLLVLFDVVSKERHVGRAARKLNLSPSAVSHGLGRLRRLFADPLFLRTPKGVVPTERALTLQSAVSEILSRVEQIVAISTPFDASRSARRFTVGLPDATTVVLLPALLPTLRRSAPFIDLGFRHIFPASALSELEQRTIDVALVAIDEVPARFVSTPIYEEHFVIAARKGHSFLKRPTLKRYCEAQHILASASGDVHGFVDQVLEAKGLSRRVSVVVSNFMLALAAIENSDLLTALPRSLASAYAARFGAAWVKPPLALRPYTLHVLTSQSAMQDAGIVWLCDTLVNASRALPSRSSRRRAG